MRSSLLFLSILAVSSTGLSQVSRDKFNIQEGKNINLLQETKALNLQSEESVQVAPARSTLLVTLLGGLSQPHHLVAESHGNTVDYSFGQPLPLVTAQFGHYPTFATGKAGRLGWSASLGYGYGGYNTTYVKTALHVVPAHLSLTYRGDWTSNQKIIPYVMAGPAAWTYFQRGLDQYNTSQSFLLGSGAAGLALDLNRMGLVKSRNTAEIVLQYQRNVGSVSDKVDLNGNTYELGTTLVL